MAQVRLAILVGVIGAVGLSGCGSAEVESNYGYAWDRSVNGTGAFAELLRAEGHTVRTAVRFSDELADWADVIVRFAPYPGPPERREARRYLEWLTGVGERRMVYVVRDYDAQAEYWEGVVELLGKRGKADLKNRAETHRDRVRDWASRLPLRPKETADAEDWFAVRGTPSGPQVCKTLGGPWGASLDPKQVALTRHETLDVQSETVLLTGDGRTLAMQWSLLNQSQVLVVANGSFLLNATLVNRARRPLALRTIKWCGAPPLNVALLEGRFVLGATGESSNSVFEILKVPPFGWVAAQLMVLGLAACLARAPRLGRPRPEPPSGEDRPVAHPKALGALLARTRQADDARSILDAYRRWRTPSHHVRVAAPPDSDSIRSLSPHESAQNE